MGLFRNKEIEAPAQEPQELQIRVPDIKEYLVREYEAAKDRELEIERLENEIEAGKELKIKYDAAMVTLKEYKDRLDNEETKRDKLRQEIAKERAARHEAQDNQNSYKIRFHELNRTKDELRDEVIGDVKKTIKEALLSHKGNLSKKAIAEIIDNIH